jgi:hypothetical protein
MFGMRLEQLDNALTLSIYALIEGTCWACVCVGFAVAHFCSPFSLVRADFAIFMTCKSCFEAKFVRSLTSALL